MLHIIWGWSTQDTRSQESKNMIASANGVRDSNSRKVVRETLEKAGQCISDKTASREHHRQELKPFHVIAKPLKTNTHIEGRKWLADFVVQDISLIT